MNQMLLTEATRAVPVPPRLRTRPIDSRGYLVPWFIAKTGPSEWDFRTIRPNGIKIAVTRNTCWLCGQPLGRYMTFVIGPMCAVNRVTAEPPCHKDCARYACQACPFLTQPRMKRNEKDMPEKSDPPGVMIKRNPGVALLWTTRGYQIENDLFHISDPTDVEWWSQRRPATRQEVCEAIASGLPILAETCKGDLDCIGALAMATRRALVLVPNDSEGVLS